MSKPYHLNHPTISFRTKNKLEYTRIKQMVKNSGKSESDFIREIVLDAEKKESQSYKNGYRDAFNKFALPCNICKKPMLFDVCENPETNKKIFEIFGTYAHTECIEKKKKQDEKQEAAERKANFDRMFGNNY